jgi:hypothetical protein
VKSWQPGQIFQPDNLQSSVPCSGRVQIAARVG